MRDVSCARVCIFAHLHGLGDFRRIVALRGSPSLGNRTKAAARPVRGLCGGWWRSCPCCGGSRRGAAVRGYCASANHLISLLQCRVVLMPAQTLLLFGIIRGVILRHRDRELLCFEWVRGARVRVLSVNDAERRFLPLEFGEERLSGGGDALRYPLEDWLASRSAPVGRHFMRNLMDSLGLNINSPDYPRKGTLTCDMGSLELAAKGDLIRTA